MPHHEKVDTVPGQTIGEEALFHASCRAPREGDITIVKVGFGIAPT